MTSAPFNFITGLEHLAGRYDVCLCDVWGVIHNGVVRFDAAVDALERFRGGGGSVALITNAPRPAASVVAQLEHLGITGRAYDRVITSGDVTRDLITSNAVRRIHHLGPDRDLPFFDGLDAVRVAPDNAEAVVCTGLIDDEAETPDDYRSALDGFRRNGLPFYCANPDRVVRRGETLFYCAGALADLYRELGGSVVVAGKPNAPIYGRALQEMTELRGAEPGPGRILVIGDGLETDMEGAAARGYDALFVTGGIHADEAVSQGVGNDAPDLWERLRSLDRLQVAGIMSDLTW